MDCIKIATQKNGSHEDGVWDFLIDCSFLIDCQKDEKCIMSLFANLMRSTKNVEYNCLVLIKSNCNFYFVTLLSTPDSFFTQKNTRRMERSNSS